MAFKRVDWRNLEYSRTGLTGELNLTENGRKVEHLIFNDSSGLNKAINILKKYGFGELSEEQVKKETEQITKELKWLGKDIEW